MQALSFVLVHYLHNDGPENQISIQRFYQLTLLEEHKLINVFQRVLEGQIQLVLITPESLIHNMANRVMLFRRPYCVLEDMEIVPTSIYISLETKLGKNYRPSWIPKYLAQF